MIVAAAIQYRGETWTLPPPARHCHILHAFLGAHMRPIQKMPKAELGYECIVNQSEVTQGFVTDTGEFVERLRAAAIAVTAGQISAPNNPPDLYSEDLW